MGWPMQYYPNAPYVEYKSDNRYLVRFAGVECGESFGENVGFKQDLVADRSNPANQGLLNHPCQALPSVDPYQHLPR